MKAWISATVRAVLAAGLSVAVLAPASAHAAVCARPRHLKVLVDSARIIVWDIKTGDQEHLSTTYYACERPHGKARVLDHTFSVPQADSAVEKLVSAGLFVAASEGQGSYLRGTRSIWVKDVPTGRTTFLITTDVYRAEPPLPEPVADLEQLGTPIGRGAQQLVLNARGDVAWLGQTAESPAAPHESVLYLHDSRGTHQIAAGRDITNLAFRGSLLTWNAAGAGQSTQA